MKNKIGICLVLNNALSELAYQIFVFAIPIYIFIQTSSPLAMSTFRALQLLPNVLLGIFIGVLIDRLHKHKILFFSVTSQFFLFLVMYGLFYFNIFSLIHVYIITFFLYTCVLLFDHANYSIIPFVIEKNQLGQINSAISMMDTGISLLGPALAGMIVALGGMDGTFFSIVFIFTILFIPVLMLKKEPIKKNKVENDLDLKNDLMLGFKYLRKDNKELLNFTFLILFVNIALSFSAAIIIYYSLNNLHMASKELGLILSTSSIGGILGSIFFKKINDLLHNGKNTILFCLVLLTVSQLMLFFSIGSFVLVVGLFITNLSLFVLNIYYSTYRHMYTPAQIMGRVTTATSMIMKLSAPISFISAGFLAETINIKMIFLFSAAILSIVIIGFLRKKIKEI